MLTGRFGFLFSLRRVPRESCRFDTNGSSRRDVQMRGHYLYYVGREEENEMDLPKPRMIYNRRDKAGGE